MTIEEATDYYNATIVLKPMPGNAREFFLPNLDGYTIFVNEALGLMSSALLSSMNLNISAGAIFITLTM